MGQQNHEPVGDRPITRERVIDAIHDYLKAASSGHFTTQDIARHLGVSEYPVRTAFTHLVRNEHIEVVPGVRSKRYLGQPEDPTKRRHTDCYFAAVYQVKEQAAEVNFAALNRAFGFA